VGKVFCIGIDGGLPFEVKDSIERNRIFGIDYFSLRLRRLTRTVLCVCRIACVSRVTAVHHLIFVDKPWRTLNSVDNNNNV
jgi:hypothetical protein